MSERGNIVSENILSGDISGSSSMSGKIAAVFGQDGASAYQIAVSRGYTGTEEEWLASLKGEQGAKGEKGEQGIQGVKGDKGDTGEPGAKGENGHSPVITAVKAGKITTIQADGRAIAEIHDGEDGEIAGNAVLYTGQTLTEAQKAQARTNIGAGTSDFSGSYNDLNDKPSIPGAYTLPAATAEALGGVKIGDGISIAEDGTIRVSGGGSVEDLPFHLIQTVSVTNDDGVSKIVISTDSDGNSFELDEAYAIVTSRTRYGGYAYATLSVNNHSVGEERNGSNKTLIRFWKFLGRWVASYTTYDYASGGMGSIWGLGHSAYILNILPDNPKITSLGFTYTACEMEVWGR